MNILDAIYKVAHAYPGGIPALAVRMGKSPNVLQNKVNPNVETHHATAEEAAQIADLANSDEIAKSFAARRNLVCIPMPEFSGISDAELLDLFLKLEKEKGEFALIVQRSLSDGGIDPGEFKRIKKEYMDYCAAGAEVMSRLESMIVERRKVAR